MDICFGDTRLTNHSVPTKLQKQNSLNLPDNVRKYFLAVSEMTTMF